MNIFETVKAAVTVKQAAEYCVLSVNRNNMVSCPFRNDRHPSMKLNEDYFYCFGCGTSGDVIDLVAKLFNLSCSEAVAKLAEDFGIGSDKPPSAGARAIPKYDLDVSQPESGCAGVLRDYIHLLETWKKDYAPADYGGDFDNRYAEACRELDYIKYLAEAKHEHRENAEQELRPGMDKRVKTETVVLLSKGEIDSKKVRVEFSLEDMDMSGFQQGATYEQRKAYVLEHTGLKVSSLYISQVKRKCGLDVGQNYNLLKKEGAKVPQCPPKKEAAIVEALKHFQMI